jgi:hypothetical protein
MPENPRVRVAEIADSARGELATDVVAQREPASIQEAEIRTDKLA